MHHYLRDTLWSELRYAYRVCAARKLVSGAVVLIVAACLGGLTAIGGVAKQVLFDPLPFADAERLTRVALADPATSRRMPVRYAEFDAWRTGASAFETLVPFSSGRPTLQSLDVAEAFDTAYVGEGMDRLLGVVPALGRIFQPTDFVPGARGVVLLTDSAWRRLFHSDLNIIGRALVVDGVSQNVIGVLPAMAYEYPRSTFGLDAWMPLPATANSNRMVSVVGRLRRESSLDAAGEQVRALSAGLTATRPAASRNFRLDVFPLSEEGASAPRNALLLLAWALAVVSAIAIVNIANLLLARSQERRSDLSILAALGLDRAALARRLLLESVLLTTAGVVLGLVAAPWLMQVFVSFYPEPLPRPVTGMAVIAVAPFAVALALFTAFAAALPVLLTTVKSVSALDARAADRAGTLPGTRRRLRSVLVATQLAMSVVLLSVAVQLVRTFVTVTAISPGYDESLLAFSMGMVQRDRSPAQAFRFYEDLISSLSQQPGIVAVGATSSLPAQGGHRATDVRFSGPGATEQPPQGVISNVVTPGFLEFMGIRLLRGRDLDPAAGAGTVPTVVVNEQLARDAFGTVDVVGRAMTWNGMQWEIVGVSANLRQRGPARPIDPAFYVSWRQQPEPPIFVLVRTALDPAATSAAIRTSLTAADGQRMAPIHTMATLADRSAEITRRERFGAATTIAIGGLAIALVIAGIYANLSYSVTQRRREIAVRMALGASTRNVQRRLIGGALLVAIAGTVAGLIGTGISGKWLEASIPGFKSADWLSSGFTVAMLLALAALSAWLPARGASRTDPVVLLRGE